MIDVENQVFTKIHTVLTKAFPKIELGSTDDRVPSSFPYVCVKEVDNYIYTKTIDSGSGENHVKVMYQVDVYSNKVSGRKSEAKKILAKADEVLRGLGFTRLSSSPVDMDNGTICRYVARYSAVVSKTEKVYRS